MHVLWNPQLDTGVPPCPIEHKDDLLLWAGSDLAREFGELDFKDRDTHRRGQMEDGATRGGMDKADEITPGEAVLYRGDGTLANRRPDPTQQRL